MGTASHLQRRIKETLLVVGALLCLLVVSGCVSSVTIGGNQDPGDFSAPPPAGPRLAAGLRISAVTISQGVSIDLYREGVAAESYTAPLLTEREGIVRVFVDPTDDWSPRLVHGELVVHSGGEELLVIDEVLPEGPSRPASSETTFDFPIGPGLITTGSSLAVRLWEASLEPGEDELGSREEAAWPRTGTAPLFATEAGGVVRVALLPIQYQHDGSERLPVTTPEQLALIEDRLWQVYPLREVELTVLEPEPTDIEVLGDGTGWSDLLSSLRDVRSSRSIPFDTYVHALVNPAPSMASFCGAGCTLGLAYRVSSPFSADSKVGLGTGYEGSRTGRTLVHELGHQHDRGHAPCGGVGNPDLAFPYEDGGIGVEGFDVLSGDRIAPEVYADFMSYCPDLWASDYTWKALHDRILSVEGLRGSRDEPRRESYFSFAVDGSGQLRFERRHTLSVEEPDPAWPVQLLDAQGLVLAEVEASFLAFSDLPGGTLMVPDKVKGVSAVRSAGVEYSVVVAHSN